MTTRPLDIAVIGAGNIGTAMAALLSHAGAHVHLVARGVRLSEVREKGVTLDDRGNVIHARPEACDALTRPMDAVFLCVKSQSLAAAVRANAAGIGPDTLVIPMVNGMPFWFFATPEGMDDIPYLDPQGDLAERLFPHQILGAVLLMTVRMEGNRALSSNTPTLSIGPIIEGADRPRIAALIEVLEAGGVRVDLTEDIHQKVLVKLLANLATNPLTALSGATLEEVGQRPVLREIATRLATEFRDWATMQGFTLPDNDWLVDLMIDAGPFPTSMLQDARAGRALELDAICRAPLALSRRDGTDMPLLARLIAELETQSALPLSETALPAVLGRLFPDTAFSKG
ncbi:ketopantoate reductase family protein [Celeribacter persicus]|nr:2-dehydropantoate 2-reductase N-terminal domain-containing protein [Celeribacter persicus]